MTWFYLALLAPLLYAVVTLVDDSLLSFVYKSPYLASVSAGFYGALPLLSRFFVHSHALPTRLALLAVGAGVLNLIYYFFYFKGLETDSPAVVIALFGLGPALLPFFARLIVHEHLAAMEGVGFVIVLLASLGLAVVDLKQFKFSKALAFVAIAVVAMDMMALMTKYVYQRSDFYSAYLYFAAGMGLGAIGFFLVKFTDNRRTVRHIAKSIKRLLPVFVLAELTGVAAEVTLNMAISRGPVSLVKVIESIQPMFMLLIAYGLYPFWPKYFREAAEGHARRKFTLMAVIIAGLLVISLAAR